MRQEEAEEAANFVDADVVDADEDEDVVDLILDNPPPPHRKTSMRMHGELLGIEEVIGRGM